MTHRAKVLSRLEQIKLPLPEKKILERQWLETNISNGTEYAFDFKSAVPPEGKVVWIIGTELNSVPETMMRLSIYGAFNVRPSEIQYIDHANNSKGRSVYRYDSIVEKYSDPSSAFHKPAVAGKMLLDSNLSGWKQFAEQWEKVAKVNYFKKPSHRFKQDNLLMLCLNPRLGVIPEINQKLSVSCRSIIADMDCTTIFDLGSRKHFGLNDSDRAVDSLRGLISKTHLILEQRVVHLESRNKPVALLREVVFTEEMTAAAMDVSVGLKSIMTSAFLKLPLWQDVADRLAEDLKFTPDQFEELSEKAGRLDAHTNNNSLFKVEESHVLTDKAAYVSRVESYFLQGGSEVVGVYEDIFGDLPFYKSNAQFVRDCASKDYDAHVDDLDFVFPEFAITNAAQIEVNTNPSSFELS